MNYYGYGAEKDFLKAREYFEKAAQQDANIEAQAEASYMLAIICCAALDGKKDTLKARQYLEKAANQNANARVKDKAMSWLRFMKK